MNLKRTLIERLPPGAKRLLAVPYDLYQTRTANRQFARKQLPDYERADDAPRHMLLVVVDALRTDHVDEELTPYLAGLNGCNAITPGAWTFPAVSSMLSGVYPHEHGAMRRTDDPADAEGFNLPPRMDEDRETITEALAGAGYETYGGFGHDTPFVALSGRFHEHDLYHNVTATAEDVLERNPRYLTRAKSFDSFLVVGPWIRTADAVDLDAVTVRTARNGEVVAAGGVDGMRFTPRELVAYHSRVMTLEPGDVLLTGTPGAATVEPGDSVRAVVEGVGTAAADVVRRGGDGA